MQQELYDLGVSIRVNNAGQNGFRIEQGEKSTIYGNANALATSFMDVLLPKIAHEIGHWYYTTQLTDEGRSEVNDYFAAHPEYSETIKNVGETSNYKEGMDKEKIGDEGFASSFLPGAATYGLPQSDTRKIASDLPQYFTPKGSNKYHTYSPEGIQAEWDKTPKPTGVGNELDINTIGL
jgi:hypothetical protein